MKIDVRREEQLRLRRHQRHAGVQARLSAARLGAAMRACAAGAHAPRASAVGVARGRACAVALAVRRWCCWRGAHAPPACGVGWRGRRWLPVAALVRRWPGCVVRAGDAGRACAGTAALARRLPPIGARPQPATLRGGARPRRLDAAALRAARATRPGALDRGCRCSARRWRARGTRLRCALYSPPARPAPLRRGRR